MQDYRELKIEADAFDQARTDFNYVLQRVFGSMTAKESNEASVTLKLDIKLVNEFIPNYDPDIEGETRKIQKPQFKHKITSAIQIKDEKSGNFDSEMALVWDEDVQGFVLKYINNTDQRSIFDDDIRQTWDKDETDMEVIETSSSGDFMNVPLIEGEVADENALPGEVADENALPGPAGEEEDENDEGGEDDGYSYEED